MYFHYASVHFAKLGFINYVSLNKNFCFYLFFFFSIKLHDISSQVHCMAKRLWIIDHHTNMSLQDILFQSQIFNSLFCFVLFSGKEKDFYLLDPLLPQQAALLLSLAVDCTSACPYPEQGYGPWSGLHEVRTLDLCSVGVWKLRALVQLCEYSLSAENIFLIPRVGV